MKITNLTPIGVGTCEDEDIAEPVHELTFPGGQKRNTADTATHGAHLEEALFSSNKY